MTFEKRLLSVKSNLENKKHELAFNGIQSLFVDIFDGIKRPAVSEGEVRKLCESLNLLALAGSSFEYKELVLPYYQKLISLLTLSICRAQVLSDIFLEIAQVHYKLGLRENAILLASRAFYHAAELQTSESIKVQHYLSWLEQALEFESLKNYYESLISSSKVTSSFQDYHEFLKFAENTFILLLESSGSTIYQWEDFYKKNHSFLNTLVIFMNTHQILKSVENCRHEKEGSSFALEKILFEALRLLKAFLKLESNLKKSKEIKELKFSWELQLYLGNQLRGLPLPAPYAKKFEKEFSFLKDNFDDTYYWVNLIEADDKKMEPNNQVSTLTENHLVTSQRSSKTMWQIHRHRLKEIRESLWRQSADNLFIAIENYRHGVLDLFKSSIATEKVDDPNNNNRQTRSFIGISVSQSFLGALKEPCGWELCLKGSYARGDIHGYSDVDVFLLIDKKECQLHPYFQLLITRFHHFLLGMGDDWEWTGNDLARDMIESCGLSIDSGDREHLLVDYPRINLSKFTPEEKEKYLKKKLYLISTPEELASWVVDKITQKEINDDYLAAFSLLQGQGIRCSSQGQGLFKYYHDLLQKGLADKQIKTIGEQCLIARLKGDEFKKLKPEDVSQRLKNYLQLLNLVMICIYYCHKQKLSLPAFSFESWQKELSGYWHPRFLEAWLSAWQKLHTWRFLYQQKKYQRQEGNNDLNNNNAPQGRHSTSKAESDVLVRDLSVEQQKELRVIYQTLLVPFFETLSPGDRFIFHPWQAYVQGYVGKKKDPTFLAHFLQILITALEAGAGIKLTSSHLQPIWESVSDELMTVWAQQEQTLREIKALENLKTAWNDLSWGEVVRAVIEAGVDPDNLVLWEIALQSPNPSLAFFLIACGAGRDPALGPRLFAYLKQSNRCDQADLKQAKQRLSYFHPDIAWLLVTESIFQSQASVGLLGETGQMKGVDTGLVYLKPDCLKEVLVPRSGLSALFSSAMTWKKSNTTYGNRDVSCIKVGQQRFFLKWYPEAPDREESVQRLTFRLFGRGVAKGELFAYQDAEHQIHPVWVSQGVQGYNAQDVLNALSSDPKVREKSNIPFEEVPTLTGAFDKIDDASFTIQFLITTLFCQEDGKPDNFILQPIEHNHIVTHFELISIDNDHAYYEPVFVEENGTTKLQLKSLVYCLNQMKRSLDARIVQRFLSNESYDLLQSWLTELREREKAFQALFKENGKAHQESRLTFQFPSQSIPKLWERWEKLRKVLIENAQLPAIEVLCQVIPRAGWQYRMALEKNDEIAVRFANISAGQYTTAQIGNTIIQHQTRTRILPLSSKALRVSASKSATTDSQIEVVKGELEWICKLAEPFITQVLTALQEKRISEFLELFPKLILENYKSRVLETMDWSVLNPKQQTQILNLLIRQAISFEHLTFKNYADLTETQLEKLLRYSPGLQSLYLKGTGLISSRLWDMLSRYNEIIATLEFHELPKLTAFPKVVHFPALTRIVLDNVACQDWQIRAPHLKVLRIKNCVQLTRIQTGSQCLAYVKIRGCPTLKEEGVFGIIEKATKFNEVVWPETLQWSEPVLIQHYPWLLTYTWKEVQAYLAILKKIEVSVPDNPQRLSAPQTEKLYGLQCHLTTTLVTWLKERSLLPLQRMELQEKLYQRSLFSKSYSHVGLILATLTIRVFELERTENAKAAVLSNWLDEEVVKEINLIDHSMEMIFPLFLTATNSNYWKVRRRAIEVLGKLMQVVLGKVSEILPVLVKAMNDTGWQAQEAAVKALGVVVQGVPDKVSEILPVLVKATNHTDWIVRKIAVTALGVVVQVAPDKVSEIILPALWRAMRDADQQVRKAAVSVLGVVVQAAPKKMKEILPVELLTVMKGRDREDNVAALSVVVQAAPEMVGKILLALLRAMKIRCHQTDIVAAGVLVQVAPEKVSEILPALLEEMYDEDGDVREAAVEALSVVVQTVPEKVSEILPKLLEVMDNKNEYVRKAAVKALGIVVQTVPNKVSEILPPLLKAITDWHVVQEAAVEALNIVVQAVPEKVSEILPALLKAMEDIFDNVRRPAVTALGVVVQVVPEKVSEILPALWEAMRDADQQVQKAAVSALGVVVQVVPEKVNEILPALLKAMDNKNGDVREAAVKALGVAMQTVPGQVSEILPTLLKAVDDNTDWQVREAAVTALGVVVQAQPEKASEVLLSLLNGMRSMSVIRGVAANLLGKVVQGIFNNQLAFLVNFLINLYLESLDNSPTIRVKEVVFKMIETLMQSPHSFPQHAELWLMFRSSDSTPEEYEIAYILLLCMAIYTKADFDQQYAELIQSSATVSTTVKKAPLLSAPSDSLLLFPEHFEGEAEQKTQPALPSANTLLNQPTLSLMNQSDLNLPTSKGNTIMQENKNTPSNDNQQPSSTTYYSQDDQVTYIKHIMRSVQETGYLSLKKKDLNQAIVLSLLDQIKTQKIPLQGLWLNHLSAQVLASIIPQLTELLTLNASKLQIIDLSHQDWGQVSFDRFRNLITALSQCTSLKELLLNKAGIGLEQARLLALTLGAFSQLESILLGNNTLHEDAIVLMLRNMPVKKLKDLSFSGNAFSLKSVQALSKWLSQVPPTFERLYLSRCQLDVVALNKLVEGMRLNPQWRLKEICLDDNRLDDSSVTILLELITLQPQLQELTILGNPFTAEGIRQLQARLKELTINSALKKSIDQFLMTYWQALAEQTQAQQEHYLALEAWQSLQQLKPSHAKASQAIAELTSVMSKKHQVILQKIINSSDTVQRLKISHWNEGSGSGHQAIARMQEFLNKEADFFQNINDIFINIQSIKPISLRMMVVEKLSLLWSFTGCFNALDKLTVATFHAEVEKFYHSIYSESFIKQYARLALYNYLYQHDIKKALEPYVTKLIEGDQNRPLRIEIFRTLVGDKELLMQPIQHFMRYELMLNELCKSFADKPFGSQQEQEKTKEYLKHTHHFILTCRHFLEPILSQNKDNVGQLERALQKLMREKPRGDIEQKLVDALYKLIALSSDLSATQRVSRMSTYADKTTTFKGEELEAALQELIAQEIIARGSQLAMDVLQDRLEIRIALSTPSDIKEVTPPKTILLLMKQLLQHLFKQQEPVVSMEIKTNSASTYLKIHAHDLLQLEQLVGMLNRLFTPLKAPIIVKRREKGHTVIDNEFALINTINEEESKDLYNQERLSVSFDTGKKKQKLIIGKGEFGVLRLARRVTMDTKYGRVLRYHEFVGVKKLKGQKKIAAAKSEGALHASLKGLPHIIPLLHVTETESSDGQEVFYQFLTLASFGSGEVLQQCLAKLSDPLLKLKILRHVAWQLLIGLQNMHEAQIYHLDIKPSNFVMDQKGHVFWIDFGCAQKCSNGLLSGGMGDGRYFSPQRLALHRRRQPHHFYQATNAVNVSGSATDVWALGVSLLEIASGQFPFPFLTYQERLATTESYYQEQLATNAFLRENNALTELLRGFLACPTNQRLTVKQALDLPFFKEMNYQFTSDTDIEKAFDILSSLKKVEVQTSDHISKEEDKNYRDYSMTPEENDLQPQDINNNNAIPYENVTINTPPVEPRLRFSGNSIEITKEEANDDASVSAEHSSIADDQSILPTLTITRERDDDDVPELIDAEEVSEQESYRMR